MSDKALPDYVLDAIKAVRDLSRARGIVLGVEDASYWSNEFDELEADIDSMRGAPAALESAITRYAADERTRCLAIVARQRSLAEQRAAECRANGNTTALAAEDHAAAVCAAVAYEIESGMEVPNGGV